MFYGAVKVWKNLMVSELAYMKQCMVWVLKTTQSIIAELAGFVEDKSVEVACNTTGVLTYSLNVEFFSESSRDWNYTSSQQVSFKLLKWDVSKRKKKRNLCENVISIILTVAYDRMQWNSHLICLQAFMWNLRSGWGVFSTGA